MAPIPPTSPPEMPAVFLPWFMWLVIVLFSISGLVALVLLIRWASPKAQKAFKAFRERREMDKMVLPTHLDPFQTRPVILPLPVGDTAQVKEISHVQCEAHKSQEVQASDDKSAKQIFKHLKLTSIFSSLRATAESDSDSERPALKKKKAKPSWVSRLLSRLKIATHMVPSPTMDLPMQMPPPGWEDEIEPPREEPPNINNNDEMFRIAMRRMDETIRRGPPGAAKKKNPELVRKDEHDEHKGEDDLGQSSLPQSPACSLASAPPDAPAEILEDDVRTEDSSTESSCDDGTPVLSSVSDTSSDDHEDDSLPATPPLLSDALPPALAGLGIADIEVVPLEEEKVQSEDSESLEVDAVHHASDTIHEPIAVTPPHSPRKSALDVVSLVSSLEQMSFTSGYDDRTDEIDARIAVATGCTPEKLRVEAFLDIHIAAVTGQSPTRSPPQSPSRCASPRSGSPPRVRPLSAPVINTPETPTKQSRQENTGRLSRGAMLGTRTSPTGGPPATPSPRRSIQRLVTSSSPALADAPSRMGTLSTKARKGTVQLPSRPVTRTLPRPVSVPQAAAPSLQRSASRRSSTSVASSRSSQPKPVNRTSPRPVSVSVPLSLQRSTSRRLSTPATSSGASQPKTPSSRTTAASTPSRPPFVASTSTRSKPVTTCSTPSSATTPKASAQSSGPSRSGKKFPVTFEPTSTPTPQTRAMFRSLSPKPSTRMKSTAGTGSGATRRTWK
ncbi:hypothetical protein BDY19DRAFT_510686 [Irpex rosettiformis]|uniref:Uncharacterized protein n=1 Tax=Irpex rosettiformis TaxID=378272 RepID=A0ACB8UEZ1_9APHY|nr:hypothetical protein BDY19DRAFT_510686 [Irpex rosettiformis]